MKTEHLHDLWSSPDNNRLLSKQFSFRLPVHIGAKINALCEIYPQKNRTQIVADLLSTALDNLEKNLPYDIEPVEPYVQMELDRSDYENRIEQSTAYELVGHRGMFRYLANKYYKEYEEELGNEVSKPLFPKDIGSKKDVENSLK